MKIESWGPAVWVDKRSGFAFEEHLHMHVEIIYVEAGEVTAYIDGVPYTVTPGQLFIVFPNHRHSYSQKVHVNGYIAIFKSNILYQFSSELAKLSPESPVLYMPEAGEFFMRMFRASQFTDEYREYRLQSLMTMLMCDILPKLKLKSNDNSKNDNVFAILSYINKNYDQPITLETVANDLFMSKSAIMSFFREAMNTTFLHYLNKIRIDKAKQLLADSDLSVTQIATLSGFNTIRSFSRNFYLLTGVSPSEYKKNSSIPQRLP